MSKDRSNIVLWVITAIVLTSICFVGYIVLNKPEPAPYDSELIEARVNVLEQENTRLKDNIASERMKSTEFLKELNHLKSLPPKIEIRYETKYKTIDAASVGTVVSEFDSVFTNHNLK